MFYFCLRCTLLLGMLLSLLLPSPASKIFSIDKSVYNDKLRDFDAPPQLWNLGAPETLKLLENKYKVLF